MVRAIDGVLDAGKAVAAPRSTMSFANDSALLCDGVSFPKIGRKNGMQAKCDFCERQSRSWKP
jgi:hypothetical protein